LMVMLLASSGKSLLVVSGTVVEAVELNRDEDVVSGARQRAL